MSRWREGEPLQLGEVGGDDDSVDDDEDEAGQGELYNTGSGELLPLPSVAVKS